MPRDYRGERLILIYIALFLRCPHLFTLEYKGIWVFLSLFKLRLSISVSSTLLTNQHQ